MSEKITINRVENSSEETHSAACIIAFSEHKKDELGNFNAAAREAFKEYLKDKDLTPKSKELYSGKIVLINTKHEVNKYNLGTAILDVRDGVVPKLCLITEDLRIEKNMNCSDLYERVVDMYFSPWGSHFWFDKVMYLNDLRQ